MSVKTLVNSLTLEPAPGSILCRGHLWIGRHYVAVYQPGKLWDQAPPEPVYSSVPVVEVIDGTRDAIQKVLEESKK